MKKFLIAISLLFTLCSCHHNDDPEPDTLASRTVLVYMAAENNLASFAEEDLEEMKAGSKSLRKDQNLVIYVDRAGSNKTPYLARIYNGELVDTLYMSKGIAADPKVLLYALKQTKTVYPAQSYGLVLWGHASGWLISENTVMSSRAYGGSTGDGSSTSPGRYWMNIPEMADAISSAMGNDKLKFIFGDCCNFGAIEIAYELRNITEYVIGSPAEIPDMGATYDLLVPDMFIENDNFHRQMIDHYYNYYIEVYQTQQSRYYNRIPGDLNGYSVPLSAIKTSELENLASSTSRILGTIADKVSSTGNLNLENQTYYGIYSGYNHSYDMNAVLKANASISDYNTWFAAYQKAVPYCRYSAKWMSISSQLINNMDAFISTEDDCGCISMFFPGLRYTHTSPNWNKSIQKYQWNDMIHWEQYGW